MTRLDELEAIADEIHFLVKEMEQYRDYRTSMEAAFVWIHLVSKLYLKALEAASQ
jgi:hypothetical protein